MKLLNLKNYNNPVRQTISLIILIAFAVTSVVPPQMAHAMSPQGVLNLPVPGTMVSVSHGFQPTIMQGVTVHPDNPLLFDFTINPGETVLDDGDLEAESKKLVKYFLAALTVPEDQLWVNLSPYEKDRIITNEFGQTEMGRDLLAQDYMLKQLSASLMYPEEELGREFWERVHKEAQSRFGTTDIPMNTFNKIWIVPEKAVVYQNGESVFVVESKLKVMLEEDYLALEHHSLNNTDDQLEQEQITSGISSEIVNDILIPQIEKEVNEGQTFAQLRQIYNSLILASWYKKHLKNSLLNEVYVDKGKTKGLEIKDKQINQKIYDQYVTAFKKGVYNYIREDLDPETKQTIPRKYFSGGVDYAQLGKEISEVDADPNIRPFDGSKNVRVNLDAINASGEVLGSELLLSQIAADSTQIDVITSKTLHRQYQVLSRTDLSIDRRPRYIPRSMHRWSQTIRSRVLSAEQDEGYQPLSISQLKQVIRQKAEKLIEGLSKGEALKARNHLGRILRTIKTVPSQVGDKAFSSYGASRANYNDVQVTAEAIAYFNRVIVEKAKDKDRVIYMTAGMGSAYESAYYENLLYKQDSEFENKYRVFTMSRKVNVDLRNTDILRSIAHDNANTSSSYQDFESGMIADYQRTYDSDEAFKDFAQSMYRQLQVSGVLDGANDILLVEDATFHFPVFLKFVIGLYTPDLNVSVFSGRSGLSQDISGMPVLNPDELAQRFGISPQKAEKIPQYISYRLHKLPNPIVPGAVGEDGLQVYGHPSVDIAISSIAKSVVLLNEVIQFNTEHPLQLSGEDNAALSHLGSNALLDYFKWGQKGANFKLLKEIQDALFPNREDSLFPLGVNLSTDEVVTIRKDQEVTDQKLDEVIADIESLTSKKLGAKNNPLFISVRSSPEYSMPDQLDTILNIGMTDETIQSLIDSGIDEKDVLNAYRRFIGHFGTIVMGIEREDGGDLFAHRLTAYLRLKGKDSEFELSVEEQRELISDYKQRIQRLKGVRFPENDAIAQLKMAVEAISFSWDREEVKEFREFEEIPDSSGYGIIVQEMKFGNLNGRSGSGVIFSRDAATGKNEMTGDFVMKKQGSAVVSGKTRKEGMKTLKDEFPEIYQDIENIVKILERRLARVVDIEFTIENGRLYILQIRPADLKIGAERRVYHDFLEEGILDGLTKIPYLERIQKRLKKKHVLKVKSGVEQIGLFTGDYSSDGAIHGHVVFSVEKFELLLSQDIPVILAIDYSQKANFNAVLKHSKSEVGLIANFGTNRTHIGIMTNKRLIPSIINSDLQIGDNHIIIDGVMINEGNKVVLDGNNAVVFQTDHDNPLEVDRQVMKISIEDDNVMDNRSAFLTDGSFLNEDSPLLQEYDAAEILAMNWAERKELISPEQAATLLKDEYTIDRLLELNWRAWHKFVNAEAAEAKNPNDELLQIETDTRTQRKTFLHELLTLRGYIDGNELGYTDGLQEEYIHGEKIHRYNSEVVYERRIRSQEWEASVSPVRDEIRREMAELMADSPSLILDLRRETTASGELDYIVALVKAATMEKIVDVSADIQSDRANLFETQPNTHGIPISPRIDVDDDMRIRFLLGDYSVRNESGAVTLVKDDYWSPAEMRERREEIESFVQEKYEGRLVPHFQAQELRGHQRKGNGYIGYSFWFTEDVAIDQQTLDQHSQSYPIYEIAVDVNRSEVIDKTRAKLVTLTQSIPGLHVDERIYQFPRKLGSDTVTSERRVFKIWNEYQDDARWLEDKQQVRSLLFEDAADIRNFAYLSGDLSTIHFPLLLLSKEFPGDYIGELQSFNGVFLSPVQQEAASNGLAILSQILNSQGYNIDRGDDEGGSQNINIEILNNVSGNFEADNIRRSLKNLPFTFGLKDHDSSKEFNFYSRAVVISLEMLINMGVRGSANQVEQNQINRAIKETDFTFREKRGFSEIVGDQAVLAEGREGDSPLELLGQLFGLDRFFGSSRRQLSQGETEWQRVLDDGYDVHIDKYSHKRAKNAYWAQITKDGRKNEKSQVVYYVYPKLKLIVVDLLVPLFPDKDSRDYKPGRGRALIKRLFNSKEYAGYNIISQANSNARTAYLKMPNYHEDPTTPMVTDNSPTDTRNGFKGLMLVPELRDKYEVFRQGILNSSSFGDLAEDAQDYLQEELEKSTVLLTVPEDSAMLVDDLFSERESSLIHGLWNQLTKSSQGDRNELASDLEAYLNDQSDDNTKYFVSVGNWMRFYDLVEEVAQLYDPGKVSRIYDSYSNLFEFSLIKLLVHIGDFAEENGAMVIRVSEGQDGEFQFDTVLMDRGNLFVDKDGAHLKIEEEMAYVNSAGHRAYAPGLSMAVVASDRFAVTTAQHDNTSGTKAFYWEAGYDFDQYEVVREKELEESPIQDGTMIVVSSKLKMDSRLGWMTRHQSAKSDVAMLVKEKSDLRHIGILHPVSMIPVDLVGTVKAQRIIEEASSQGLDYFQVLDSESRYEVGSYVVYSRTALESILTQETYKNVLERSFVPTSTDDYIEFIAKGRDRYIANRDAAFIIRYTFGGVLPPDTVNLTLTRDLESLAGVVAKPFIVSTNVEGVIQQLALGINQSIDYYNLLIAENSDDSALIEELSSTIQKLRRLHGELYTDRGDFDFNRNLIRINQLQTRDVGQFITPRNRVTIQIRSDSAILAEASKIVGKEKEQFKVMYQAGDYTPGVLAQMYQSAVNISQAMEIDGLENKRIARLRKAGGYAKGYLLIRERDPLTGEIIEENEEGRLLRDGTLQPRIDKGSVIKELGDWIEADGDQLRAALVSKMKEEFDDIILESENVLSGDDSRTDRLIVVLTNYMEAVIALQDSIPEELSIRGKNLKIVPLTKELILSHTLRFAELLNSITSTDRLGHIEKGLRRTVQNQAQYDPDMSFALIDQTGLPHAMAVAYKPNGKDYLHLKHLVVDEQLYGSAAASWILYKTFETAQSNGLAESRWETYYNPEDDSTDYARANAFYRKIGAAFVDYGEIESEVDFKIGHDQALARLFQEFHIRTDSALLADVPTELQINQTQLILKRLTPQLFKLHKTEFANLIQLQDGDVPIAWTEEAIVNSADKLQEYNPRYSYAVFNQKGQPIAVTVAFNPKRTTYIELASFHVDEGFQGTAVASWLLYQTFKSAVEDGYELARWETFPKLSKGGLSRATSFYRKIGAEIEDKKKMAAMSWLKYTFDLPNRIQNIFDEFSSKLQDSALLSHVEFHQTGNEAVIKNILKQAEKGRPVILIEEGQYFELSMDDDEQIKRKEVSAVALLPTHKKFPYPIIVAEQDRDIEHYLNHRLPEEVIIKVTNTGVYVDGIKQIGVNRTGLHDLVHLAYASDVVPDHSYIMDIAAIHALLGLQKRPKNIVRELVLEEGVVGKVENYIINQAQRDQTEADRILEKGLDTIYSVSGWTPRQFQAFVRQVTLMREQFEENGFIEVRHRLKMQINAADVNTLKYDLEGELLTDEAVIADLPQEVTYLKGRLKVVHLTPELLSQNNNAFAKLFKQQNNTGKTIEQLERRVDTLSKVPNEYSVYHSFAVLNEQGEPIGISMSHPAKHGNYIYLSSFAVREEYQGSGISAWLLHKTFNQALQTGYRQARWDTYPSKTSDVHQRANGFYSKIGAKPFKKDEYETHTTFEYRYDIEEGLPKIADEYVKRSNRSIRQNWEVEWPESIKRQLARTVVKNILNQPSKIHLISQYILDRAIEYIESGYDISVDISLVENTDYVTTGPGRPHLSPEYPPAAQDEMLEEYRQAEMRSNGIPLEVEVLRITKTKRISDKDESMLSMSESDSRAMIERHLKSEHYHLISQYYVEQVMKWFNDPDSQVVDIEVIYNPAEKYDEETMNSAIWDSMSGNIDYTKMVVDTPESVEVRPIYRDESMLSMTESIADVLKEAGISDSINTFETAVSIIQILVSAKSDSVKRDQLGQILELGSMKKVRQESAILKSKLDAIVQYDKDLLVTMRAEMYGDQVSNDRVNRNLLDLFEEVDNVESIGSLRIGFREGTLTGEQQFLIARAVKWISLKFPKLKQNLLKQMDKESLILMSKDEPDVVYRLMAHEIDHMPIGAMEALVMFTEEANLPEAEIILNPRIFEESRYVSLVLLLVQHMFTDIPDTLARFRDKGSDAGFTPNEQRQQQINGFTQVINVITEMLAEVEVMEELPDLKRVLENELMFNILTRETWIQTPVQDEAMVGESNQPGGIDLNPNNFEIEVTGEASQIPVQFDKQKLMDINIEGFVPVIINITPITNIPLLLGIKNSPENNPTEISLDEEILPKDRIGRIRPQVMDELSRL